MIRKTLSIALLALLGSGRCTAQETKFVRSQGKEIVDPDGTPILLRGINLGNWLVPEGYMFKFDSTTSPRMIHEVFPSLSGRKKRHHSGRNIGSVTSRGTTYGSSGPSD